MSMCCAPHPTETYNCTKSEGHRSRYHVCFLTDLGAFGDQPCQVYLRWKKGTPVDLDSPARQRVRSLIRPGTPAQNAEFAKDLVARAMEKYNASTRSETTPPPADV